jgi:hypothetical protein
MFVYWLLLIKVLIVTEEFAVDLGRRFRWGDPFLPCFSQETDVFQLKIHWGEVQSCFVRVR